MGQWAANVRRASKEKDGCKMITYTVDSYDYNKIRMAKNCKSVRKKSKKEGKYMVKDIVAAFDIETSKIQYKIDDDGTPRYQAFMYIWMCAIEEDVIIGRTWDDYKIFIQRIEAQLENDECLWIFIHNLSYEFQFLSGIFDFDNDNVFALDRRKVARAKCGKIEYRCSYIHSNMSLAEWAKKMNVKHQKKVGDLDYSVDRYPWTVLTEEELGYCIHDVLSVVECIHADMAADHDQLCDLPLTNTGYVRRDCKAAMHSWAYWNLTPLKPDIELWRVCREAFRGGDTHANRYYVGMILDDVKSVDRSSSYPDVMCNELFPMTPFQRYANPSLLSLLTLITKRKRAVLARIRFKGVRLRDTMNGFPYIPISKCRLLLHPINDNGRVLSADFFEITLTDIDWNIVAREYDWDDVEVIDLWYSRYGYLPQPLRDTVLDYYRKKTELKGIEGEEVLYMKSKNKLNSCYGMAAQNPVKPEILYDDGEWSIACDKTETELLDSYNAHAFLVYQWGVWVTAHARYQLREMLWNAGHKAVYCDTDSVKHVGDVSWDDYNRERERKSQESGSFARDKTGRVYYMGVADSDGTYSRFITQGAKKYAYNDETGIHITVAGVGKKKGAEELREKGGLEAFVPGLTFVKAGGTESVYNDTPEIDLISVEGRKLPITRNVVILDSTYTLGLTNEYMNILKNARFILEDMDRKY